MVYRRPANDQHEYVCVKRGCPVRMRLILEVESERCYIMATTNIEHDHSKCTRTKNNKSQRLNEATRNKVIELIKFGMFLSFVIIKFIK